jgi:multidrug resistance efflux pump
MRERAAALTPEELERELLGTEARAGHAGAAALQLVRSPRRARALAVLLLALLALAVAFLVLPWRQTAAGSGTVTSFTPGVRPQRIEAQIGGRIVRWHVVEGAEVKAGDVLAELRDLNPTFMDPAFAEKLGSVQQATVEAQRLAVEAARERTRQAGERLAAAEASERNAEIERDTARIRERRAQRLAGRGLVATRDLETAVLALRKSEADLVRARTARAAAAQDLELFRKEEARAGAVAEATVAEAGLRAANARARAEARLVRAPIDGTVVRVASAGPGETVSEGAQLALVVPTTDDVAVQVYVSALDAALIEPGARVRLQFAGFPALQVSGWSSVAIGTYGGTVAVVDAVDDGAGRYRVLVVPDPAEPPWPSRRFLRQGTAASAWVLLQEVRVGWEIWRQLNGLPPTIPVRASALGGKSK